VLFSLSKKNPGSFTKLGPKKKKKTNICLINFGKMCFCYYKVLICACPNGHIILNALFERWGGKYVQKVFYASKLKK